MQHQSQFAGELSCLYCDGTINLVVWPLNGDAIPFYFEEVPGSYSVEIGCYSCGKTSFVVWDENPGPIEELETGEEEVGHAHGPSDHPQFYLAVKVTVEQAISQGVTDFNELLRQADEGLSELYDIKELHSLLRRAWIEVHRGQ